MELVKNKQPIVPKLHRQLIVLVVVVNQEHIKHKHPMTVRVKIGIQHVVQGHILMQEPQPEIGYVMNAQMDSIKILTLIQMIPRVNLVQWVRVL